jgi:hypothetical protein
MCDSACKSWSLVRREPYEVYEQVSDGSQSAADRRKKSHEDRNASYNRKTAKTPRRSSLMIWGGQDKNTLSGGIQRNNEPEEGKAPSGKPVWKRGE